MTTKAIVTLIFFALNTIQSSTAFSSTPSFSTRKRSCDTFSAFPTSSFFGRASRTRQHDPLQSKQQQQQQLSKRMKNVPSSFYSFTALSVSLTPSEKQQSSEEDANDDDAEIINLISSSLSSSSPPQPTTTTTSKSNDKKTELWLDLRGTAIVPTKTALSQLFSKEIIDGMDQILISHDDLDLVLKIKQHESKGAAADGLDNDIWNLILCETKNGSILHINAAAAVEQENDELETTSATILGKVMTIKEHEIVDPIHAMDTVLSNKWIVVDPSNLKDEKERLESVSSLIEFIGGIAVMSSSSASSLPLLLDLNKEEDEESNKENEKNRGGIAIVCSTKTDLFQAGASIQSLLSSATGLVETTESGILLPKTVEKSMDDATAAAATTTDGIKSAVVIPVDTMLWKTALFVLNDNDRGDDYDDAISE